MGRSSDLTPDEPYVPSDPDIIGITNPDRDSGGRGRNGGANMASSSKFLGRVRPGTWSPGMTKPEGCLGFRKGWVENYVKAQEEAEEDEARQENGEAGQSGRGGLRDPKIREMIAALKRRVLAGEALTKPELEQLGTLVLLDNAESWRPSVRQAAAKQLVLLTGADRVDAVDEATKLRARERLLGKSRKKG